MKIENWPLEKIKPYPNNPRKNESAVAIVAKSIEEYGWRQPITVDKDGVIIIGHTRLKAAQKLGLTTAPVHQAIELSPDQVKALRILDNKSNEYSEWIDELLIQEMGELSQSEFDLILTGFKQNEIDEILNSFNQTENKNDADALPEAVESICKPGDLWQLGNHRLLCGDSTKANDAEILMDGENAELLFTSPPYSDMRDYNDGKDLSISNLVNFISVFYAYAEYQVINLGIQRKDNEIIEFWNDYILKEKESGYKFLSWNVWSREGMGGSIANMSSMFRIEHEWIFVFGKKRKELNNTQKNKSSGLHTGISNRQKDGTTKKTSPKIVKEYGRLSSVLTMCYGNSTEHPACFPVDFPEKYIKAMTDIKNNVIDPFLGSGSTLIACEKTNRRCFGMEIDPNYCDVIIKRWENYTGNKAEKL